VHKEATFPTSALTSTIEFQSNVTAAFGPVLDDVDLHSCLLVVCPG
jgi:hypothetical protein